LLIEKKIVLFLIITSLVVAGCAQRINDQVPVETSAPDIGIPLDTITTDIEVAYPPLINSANIESAYPIEENDVSYPQGPDFAIDEPVKKDDLVVTGAGPKHVPIMLVDVSEMGRLIGETVISEDGRFTIIIESPLKKSNFIGLQLGDLTGTDFNENDFVYNENYYVRPMIGILFDMVIVQ